MSEMIDKILNSEFEEKKSIDLMVYNIDLNEVKTVTLYPNHKWGG